MKPNRLFLLVIIFLFSASIQPPQLLAQLRNLTLEESVLRQRSTLAPQRLPMLQFIKGSDEFIFVDNTGQEETLVRMNASAKEAGRSTLSGYNKHLRAAGADTLKRFVPAEWTSKGLLRMYQPGKVVDTDVRKGVSVATDSPIPDDAQFTEHSSGAAAAWVRENNIQVSGSSGVKTITQDGSADIVYGTTVHREEFGIQKGLFWSPDANKLAFYRMDQSMVSPYIIPDFTEVPVRSKTIRYPFSGDTSHQVTVGVYSLNENKVIYLKTGEPKEQYLTNVSWSPDSKTIYLAVLNREQNHMKLNAYDAVSGAFKSTLFEERDSRYVEPQHPLLFVPNDASKFIWQSNRDGWNHLYLYDTSGRLIRQLTSGRWEVVSVDGFDSKSSALFFHATIEGPLNRDFCKVILSNAQLTKLTQGTGVHFAQVSASGKRILDNFSSPDIPREIRLLDENGRIIKSLLKAPDPLSGVRMGSLKIFPLKSENGDTLWSRMITPPDFDPSKKYPVIVYLYGGPKLQLITNSWLGGAELWYHYMAQKGYVIFSLDNHGSANRGRDFEQAVFRKLGSLEMSDQMHGLNYLKSLPYIDPARIGVFGWSYGGFMSTSLMTRQPGQFKVAVAGGPVIDWNWYEVMYTERYMDTPAENPEGYKENSLLQYIPNLKGKLLLIHGSDDPVVVWQHSMNYIRESVNKGVQVDYMVYPGHEHNVLGKDRVHLMNKVCDYFIQNL